MKTNVLMLGVDKGVADFCVYTGNGNWEDLTDKRGRDVIRVEFAVDVSDMKSFNRKYLEAVEFVNNSHPVEAESIPTLPATLQRWEPIDRGMLQSPHGEYYEAHEVDELLLAAQVRQDEVDVHLSAALVMLGQLTESLNPAPGSTTWDRLRNIESSLLTVQDGE